MQNVVLTFIHLQINHMQETVTPPTPKQKKFGQSNVGTVQVYIHFRSQNALTCSINGLTNNLLILFGQKCWCRGHASCLEMKNPATLYLLHLPPKERTQQKENWQHKETGLITLHSKLLYVPSSSLGTAKYSLSLVVHLARQTTLCP